MEVLGGGIGVAEVEANAHPLLQVFPDGEDSAARVRADEVPDQEVTHARLLAELVHQNADEERSTGETPVVFVQGGEELLHGLEGWSAVELVEDVALATGDAHQLAYGPAALGDEGVDDDVAAESDAHCAVGKDLVVEEQGVQAGRGSSAGEAPILGELGKA